MRTRPKILRVTLVLAIMLLGSVSLAQASFWVKGVCFHYCPDYGELGEGLEKVNPYYDTPSRLESGSGPAFSLGYDLSKTFAVRFDTFSFKARADYFHLRLPDKFFFRTSTSPMLLSLVYRIPREGQFQPYVGAGVGSFPSKLTITSNLHKGIKEKDSPTGFQVFVGAEYRDVMGLFLSGEVGYLSAKAEYPGYRCIESCSTDWSGMLINIGFGYSFGG